MKDGINASTKTLVCYYADTVSIRTKAKRKQNKCPCQETYLGIGVLKRASSIWRLGENDADSGQEDGSQA